jgi:hypothetical protein
MKVAILFLRVAFHSREAVLLLEVAVAASA